MLTFEACYIIPADGELKEVQNLEGGEASLTGESVTSIEFVELILGMGVSNGDPTNTRCSGRTV